MYLWRRNYARADYEASNVIRMGDAWVARLVGYNEARANFALLNEIPERLRAHCDKLETELRAAGEVRDKILANRIKELVDGDLPAKLISKRLLQNTNNGEIETLQAEIEDVALQLNRYSEGLDDAFREAVETATQLMARKSVGALLSDARATSTPDDDSVAHKIKDLESSADTLARNIEKKRRKLDQITKRRREMLNLASNFRRRRYDDDNSFFEPDDLAEDLLKLLLQGLISAAEYWIRSKGFHGWRGRSADPFRRSGGFPPFGGRRSSRSRRGGKRFETGGGF
ncbi:MAG: hypothetical protein AAGG72_04825 [Pseudomonadota bacterium]